MGVRRIILGLALAAGLLWGGATAAGGAEEATPTGPCHTKCYRAKSQAYQRCRAIPPTDRAGRNACFRQADAALDSCLAGCP